MDGPRYGVIGLGAIGGTYGARLQAAGRRVAYLVRRDADAIRRDGLHVTSPWGAFDDPAPEIHDDPAAMGPCDVVLVALKTTANAVLAQILPALTHPGSVVVMLQNGYGMEADAAAIVPAAEILGALCFVCSHKRAPGRIEHLDFGQVLVAAHRSDGDGAGITPAMESFAADLRTGCVPVELDPHLEAARWAKLCWNVAYNGTSVIHRCDTRVLMDTPALREEVEALMAEVVAAAAACGAPLPPGHAQEMLERTDRMVPYLPSMRLDFDAGRPLETDAIYGRAVTAAEAAGVAVPRMRAVLDGLLELEARART